MVHHVVDHPGERVGVASLDAHRCAVRIEALHQVVRDAVALVLLTQQDVAGELGALRVVGEHVAEKAAGALGVAPSLLEQVHQHGVHRDWPAEEPHAVARSPWIE